MGFGSIGELAKEGPFDVIICNPPYHHANEGNLKGVNAGTKSTSSSTEGKSEGTSRTHSRGFGGESDSHTIPLRPLPGGAHAIDVAVQNRHEPLCALYGGGTDGLGEFRSYQKSHTQPPIPNAPSPPAPNTPRPPAPFCLDKPATLSPQQPHQTPTAVCRVWQGCWCHRAAGWWWRLWPARKPTVSEQPRRLGALRRAATYGWCGGTGTIEGARAASSSRQGLPLTVAVLLMVAVVAEVPPQRTCLVQRVALWRNTYMHEVTSSAPAQRKVEMYY